MVEREDSGRIVEDGQAFRDIAGRIFWKMVEWEWT